MKELGSTIQKPTSARRLPTVNSFCVCGYSSEFYDWEAKTTDIGTSN